MNIIQKELVPGVTVIHTPRHGHSYGMTELYGSSRTDANSGVPIGGGNVVVSSSSGKASIEIGFASNGGASCDVKISLDAGALRDLASRLIDAAHAIDCKGE